MDPARQIVLVEGGMGLVFVVYGLLARSPAMLAENWWLVAGAAVSTATVVHTDDHVVAAWELRRRAYATIAFLLGTVAVAGLVVALTGASISTVVGLGIGGMGAGLLAYRLVYGVVLPVPSSRLERASEHGL